MDPQAKIYIAGARGLLGSAIVRKLKSLGYDNLLTPTHETLELTNQDQVRAFFENESPEYVFLAAAKVGGIQANIDQPVEFLLENLKIQNNVIEACHDFKVKKLLFVGSSCIYPKESVCPIHEDTLLTGPLEPTNEGYALAKASGIRLCQFYQKQYGDAFISAIPTNLYGIGDHYDLRTSHLIPALIMKVHGAKQAGEKSIPVWGSGRPKREFMLSDDCADALVFLMKHYSDVKPVNVGTGADHSIIELANAVAQALEYPVEIETDPSKPDGMLRKLIDCSALHQMGWNHITPMDEGIRLAYTDFLNRSEP